MQAPPPRAIVLLVVAALLCGPASTRLLAACTHLGQAVQCPPGVQDGSNSVNFVPGGILWSDGTITVGNTVAPTTPAPPGGATPPGGTAPAGDNRRNYVPGADHPTLPGGATPDPGSGPGAGAGVDVPHDAGLDLVCGGRVPPLQPLLDARVGVAAVTEKTVTNPVKLAVPLDLTSVFDDFQGTFDIAGAAEAIVNSSSDGISYSNDTDDFDKADTKQKLATTCHEINCFEFVHLAAYAAGAQQVSGQGKAKIGATSGTLLGGAKISVPWDGKTEIPRGALIVGIGRFKNNPSGFNHIGISLGGGKVAHHNSGWSPFDADQKHAHPKIDTIEDAFGWLPYEEIRITYYDFQGNQYNPDAPPTPDPREGLVPQPTLTPASPRPAPATAPQSATPTTGTKGP